MIIYKTIKAENILSEFELKHIGKEGWCMGGVVCKQIAFSGAVVDRYFYHFWKKKD